MNKHILLSLIVAYFLIPKAIKAILSCSQLFIPKFSINLHLIHVCSTKYIYFRKAEVGLGNIYNVL